MDIVSIILLGALNVPLLVFSCRLFRRTFYRDKHDFWQSLLAWSFDPHAFLDKEYKHNHFAVLFLSVAVCSCIVLVLVEYELASRLVDAVRAYGPLRPFTPF